MTVTSLSVWDLTSFYPGLESPELEHDIRRLGEEIENVAQVFHRTVERQQSNGDTAPGAEAFDALLERYCALLDLHETLESYLLGFVSIDSRDATAQARFSELEQLGTNLAQLTTKLTAWIGSLNVEQLVQRSALAREHAYFLQRVRATAEHLMSPGEEDLAAELTLTAGAAWNKLHGNITSQLVVQIDGEEAPMSVARSRGFDPDRETRRRAFEAEITAWEGVAVPLAAALNSVKGTTNTLDSRRGWGSGLDLALFNNSIDRETLDAMMTAIRGSLPDFRRYLLAKAHALDLPRLAWYDIGAPVGQKGKVWSFDDATSFLVEQFGTYSPRLRDFVRQVIAERWIDAEPRPGKRDGAFCMMVRAGESRILTNFKPSYDAVSVMAHELGHAYHYYNLVGRTALQRPMPMTLAETASTFCETIVRRAALARSDEAEQLEILEAALQDATQKVVDITSRFLFEEAVFEARQRRELSVDELNDLMLDAQRQTYGDAVDPLHPFMWAVKEHYYHVNNPYYNFPYAFGLLFGLGLYAQYRADPERFKARYDELLSSTALADAATIAGGAGIDIRSPDFWEASMDVVRADIKRFETLAG